MADQSAVDREAMRIAATKVDTAAETIKGIQSKLHGHKAGLMSNWDGRAAMTFQRVFNAWDQDFRKVVTALESIHQNLVGSNITYSATEEQQELAASKVESLLNGDT